MRAIVRALRWIDAHVFGAWQCNVCGCTDHFACRGGCYWALGWERADTHVCSNCVPYNRERSALA
jgi:hypothetical protein